jgi:hypothetical protein
MEDQIFPNSKQQILCYILRTTLLFPQSIQSQLKEYPPCSTKTPESLCEHSWQQGKMKDQGLHTAPPLQDTQVSDFTETDLTKNCEKESKIKVEEHINMEDIQWDVPDIFSKEEVKENETNILRGDRKMEDKIQITSNVFTTSDIKYLIRIDNEEFAFANDEKTALSIINSLAISEVKKLSGPNVKVFRQDLQNGKEIKICTQSLGVLMNGRVVRNILIDVIPVPRVFFELPKE